MHTCVCGHKCIQLHKNSHRDTRSQVRFHVYTLSTHGDSDSPKQWGHYAATLEHTHWDLSATEKLQPRKGQTAQSHQDHGGDSHR